METNHNLHTSPVNQPNDNPGFFQSSTAKILMVGLLTLVLLIPLAFVKDLIYERSQRQKEVVSEINYKWGEDVYMYGPVLKIPYTAYSQVKTVDSATKKVITQQYAETKFAYFLPDKLNAIINVDTEKKKRSNYESVVYKSALAFNGNYALPDFSSQSIANENIQWNKASIVVKTNNIKSITGAVTINIGGRKYAFEPSAEEAEKDSVSSLETKFFDARDMFATTNPGFDFKINYKGSEQIKVVPIGKMTTVKMKSNWPSPSFDGNFIPESSHISDKGFTADWKISHLNRAFGQQHFGYLPSLKDYTFDVRFIIPVDQYQQNERAAKYGFLVIGLTFLVFFLIQSVSKISIHIFQYGMIGLALVMFYTLLISITEHSSFMLAYIIAGLSVVVMISLYSVSILKGIKFPTFIAISLAALYSFIYVIIQLENYALLVGSIGLFAILGAVMYFSRKIEWK